MFHSTVLDDLVFAQPMNLLVRWIRYRAVRGSEPRPGTTIVIVSFNTIDVLQVTVGAVRRFSPPDVELIVVDNASSDGTREWLTSQADVLRPVLLRTNLGHGRALDIGICKSTTSRVLLLDSDAFPISDDWLTKLTEPMLARGLRAVGMRGRRDRLHPACALIDRSHYLETGVSMAVYNRPLAHDEVRELGANVWDCGELFSVALHSDERELLDTTLTEFGGELMAGCVYHHCGLSVLAAGIGVPDPEHQDLWEAAVRAYLGPGR